MSQRGRFLLIPHTGDRSIRVRGFEIAKHLAQHFEVYYLICELHGQDTWWRRIRRAAKELATNVVIAPEEGVNVVLMSHLHRPRRLARIYNRWRLGRLVRSLGIEYLCNESLWMHPVPRLPGVRYIYDFVDNTLAMPSTASLRALKRQHIVEQLSRADLVTAVSREMVDFVREEFHHPSARFLPNGADIDLYRQDYTRMHEAFRQRHGLVDKCIIGFVGNHGRWSGLDFLLQVFDALRRRRSDVCLLIVGPVRGFQRLVEEYSRDPDIIFVGSQPRDMMPFFFTLLDVGVAPYELSRFINHSFPLRVIEYSAARKLVVATPLAELRRAKLPNVVLTERTVASWIGTLEQVQTAEWQQSWDAVVDRFDWRVLVDELVVWVRELDK